MIRIIKQWGECMVCGNLTQEEMSLCSDSCKSSYHRNVTMKKDNHVSDKQPSDYHLAQYILLSTECHLNSNGH